MDEKPMAIYIDIDGRKFDVSTWGGFRDAGAEISNVFRKKVELATYHKNTAINKESAGPKYEKAIAEANAWRQAKSKELMRLTRGL